MYLPKIGTSKSNTKQKPRNLTTHFNVSSSTDEDGNSGETNYKRFPSRVLKEKICIEEHPSLISVVSFLQGEFLSEGISQDERG